MSKDYAKYNTRKSVIRDRKKSRKSWQVMTIFLFLIFGGIAGVLYLNKTHKIMSAEIKAIMTEKRLVSIDKKEKNAPKKIISGKAIAKEKVNSEPQFDFYTILPKEKVAVLDRSSTNETTPKYLLQVAAVKNIYDAERMKSELALIGFEANIEQLKINDVIWYRVNVGPYYSEASAKNAQEKLSANKIRNTIVRSTSKS